MPSAIASFYWICRYLLLAMRGSLTVRKAAATA